MQHDVSLIGIIVTLSYLPHNDVLQREQLTAVREQFVSVSDLRVHETSERIKFPGTIFCFCSEDILFIFNTNKLGQLDLIKSGLLLIMGPLRGA